MLCVAMGLDGVEGDIASLGAALKELSLDGNVN